MAGRRASGELHPIGSLSQGLKGLPVLNPGLQEAFNNLTVTESRLEKEFYKRVQSNTSKKRLPAPGVVDTSTLVRTKDDTLLDIRTSVQDVGDISNYKCRLIEGKSHAQGHTDLPMYRPDTTGIEHPVHREDRGRGPQGKLVKASLAKEMVQKERRPAAGISMVGFKANAGATVTNFDDPQGNGFQEIRARRRPSIVMPQLKGPSTFIPVQDDYESYARSPDPYSPQKARNVKQGISHPSFLPKVAPHGPTNMVNQQSRKTPDNSADTGYANSKNVFRKASGTNSSTSMLPANKMNSREEKQDNSYHRRQAYSQSLEKNWFKNAITEFQKRRQDEGFVDWIRQNYDENIDDFYKAFFSSGEDEEEKKRRGIRSGSRSGKHSARKSWRKKKSSRKRKSSSRGRQSSANSRQSSARYSQSSQSPIHFYPHSPCELLHYASMDVLLSDGDLADQSDTDVETMLLSDGVEDHPIKHKMRRKRQRQEERFQSIMGQAKSDKAMEEKAEMSENLTDSELRSLRLNLPKRMDPEVYMPPELSMDPLAIQRAIAAIMKSNKQPKPRRQKQKCNKISSSGKKHVHWNASENTLITDPSSVEGYYLQERFYNEYGFLLDDRMREFVSDSEEDLDVSSVQNNKKPGSATPSTAKNRQVVPHMMKGSDKDGAQVQTCKMKRFMDKYGVNTPLESFISVPGTSVENLLHENQQADNKANNSKKLHFSQAANKIKAINAFKGASSSHSYKPNSAVALYNSQNKGSYGSYETAQDRPKSCNPNFPSVITENTRPKSANDLPSQNAAKELLRQEGQSGLLDNYALGETPHIYVHQDEIVIRPHPLVDRRYSAAPGMCYESLLFYQKQHKIYQKQQRGYKKHMHGKKTKKKKSRSRSRERSRRGSRASSTRSRSPSQGRGSRASSCAGSDIVDLIIDKTELRRTESARGFNNQMDEEIDLHDLTEGYDFPAKEVKIQIAQRRHKKAQRRASQKMAVYTNPSPSYEDTLDQGKDGRIERGTDKPEESLRQDQCNQTGHMTVQVSAGAGVAWNQKRAPPKVDITQEEIEAALPRLGRLFQEMKDCRYIRWSRRDQAIINHLESMEWASLQAQLGF